jgi:hypothetical protein
MAFLSDHYNVITCKMVLKAAISYVFETEQPFPYFGHYSSSSWLYRVFCIVTPWNFEEMKNRKIWFLYIFVSMQI